MWGERETGTVWEDGEGDLKRGERERQTKGGIFWEGMSNIGEEIGWPEKLGIPEISSYDFLLNKRGTGERDFGLSNGRDFELGREKLWESVDPTRVVHSGLTFTVQENFRSHQAKPLN